MKNIPIKFLAPAVKATSQPFVTHKPNVDVSVSPIKTGTFIPMNTYHKQQPLGTPFSDLEVFTIIAPGVVRLHAPYDSFALPQIVLYDDDIIRIRQYGSILAAISSHTKNVPSKPVQRELERFEKCQTKPFLSRSRRRAGGLLDRFLSTPLLDVDTEVKTTSGNNFTLNSARNGTINHINEGDTNLREVKVAEGASVHTNRIDRGDINAGSDNGVDYVRLFAEMLSSQKDKTPTISTATTTTFQNPFMQQSQFAINPVSHPGFPGYSGTVNPNFYFPNQPMFPGFPQKKPETTLTPDEEEKLFQRLYNRVLSDVITYLRTLQAPTRKRKRRDVDEDLLLRLLNLTEHIETKPRPAHVRITNRRGQYDIYHQPAHGTNSTLNLSYSNGKVRIHTAGPQSELLNITDPGPSFPQNSYMNNSSTQPKISVNHSMIQNPKSIGFYLILSGFCTVGFICILVIVRSIIRCIHRNSHDSTPSSPPLILKTI